MEMVDNVFPFSIKYDGVKHEVEAETYIQTLTSITTILSRLNLQLGEGQTIKIAVNSEKSGSFISALSVLVSNDLFAGAVLGNLKGLVEMMCDLVELKKIFHRVDPAQTVTNNGMVDLRDSRGTNIVNVTNNTYNFFISNDMGMQAIAELGKSLARNSEITGFQIEGGDKKVNVDKSDFPHIAAKLESQLLKRDEYPESQDLIIVKCVFEGRNRKWEFLHKGETMSAVVTDQEFWDRIDAGEKFGKGDKLKADLKITYHYDKVTQEIIERECSVIFVRGYNHRKKSPPPPKLGETFES